MWHPGWGREASRGGASSSRPWTGGDEVSTAQQAVQRCSDSAVTHQETPSLPSPETVKYCYAIHRRLELLESAGFWVDSGLSLPARAGYDTRLASCHDASPASQLPGREGASNNKRTKLGMWWVGEFCGTPAGEERLSVVVRARLARGREGTRSAQRSRQCKIHSDSAVTHQRAPTPTATSTGSSATAPPRTLAAASAAECERRFPPTSLAACCLRFAACDLPPSENGLVL